jgi:methylated-DNA-[protein]-cysteine S-methyltransferase
VEKREIAMHNEIQTIYLGRLAHSPLGPMWLAVSSVGLVAVDWDLPAEQFTHKVLQRVPGVIIKSDESQTTEALKQLADYLVGQRREFTLRIDWTGMADFQEQALRATVGIPYGGTSTYAEIARQIGIPNAARAVGRAEATNPIPLVLPCHRVIGSDGKLHGYGGPGGIHMKRWLLDLEQAHRW